jgi:hypothetical protein
MGPELARQAQQACPSHEFLCQGDVDRALVEIEDPISRFKFQRAASHRSRFYPASC